MQDAVDRSEECGPSLVVEDYDNAGGGQRRAAGKLSFNTPGQGEPRQRQREKKDLCESERHI